MAHGAHVAGAHVVWSSSQQVGPSDLARILIVHMAADAMHALGLADEMRSAGHDVGIFAIERTVVERVATDDPDLAILVRSGDSFSLPRLCAGLREVIDCRLLVVDFAAKPNARISVADEIRLVETLDAGADDYLAGSGAPSVLHARVRAALRSRPLRRRRVGPIEIGDVLIDLQAHALVVAGTTVPCPRLQFDLLVALASRPDELITRDALISSVWHLPPESVEPQRVRTAVSQIRRTLGRGPDRPRIETIARLGYRLSVGDVKSIGSSLGSVASTSR